MAAKNSRKKRRVCTNKIGYSTVGEATKVKYEMINSQTEKSGYPITVYKCPYCGKWHIGRAQINNRKNSWK